MIGRSFIKLNRNKRFNYTPRYYDGKEKNQNPYDFDSAIRRDRETVNYNDYRAHWDEARKGSRHRGNREVNTRLLIIIAILVLAFLFIIDFDLTLFSN